MKQRVTMILSAIILSVFLTACGGVSVESGILGNWKIVTDGDVQTYLEINKERMVIRRVSKSEPMTVVYILTKTGDRNFIMEVVNPETNSNEFFFEGQFKNKDTIKVVQGQGGKEVDNSELVRIDNIEEEKKKDEAEQKKKQEAEDRAQEIEAQKEEKLAREEEEKEEKRQEAEQRAREKEEAKQEAAERRTQAKEEAKRKTEQSAATEGSALKQEYQRKADDLEDKVRAEGEKAAPNRQDLEPRYYGYFYDEWDALLNEVWADLRAQMPAGEFEALKAEQNKWIQEKESTFEKMPKEPASAREAGWGYLAMENANRTHYLIENYLE